MSTSTAAFTRTAPGTASAQRLSTTGRLFISVMLIVIFEGAIRKWVAEASTLPLIMLRDLLVCYTIARALMRGLLRRQLLLAQIMLVWSCVVLGWGLLQVTLGESNFFVLLIGLRFWLLYIWFALAVASAMSEYDYVMSVRVLLASLVVMAPLAALQHFSPPGAWVNRGLEADEEDIFVVIAGVVRTTGTFSFTSGFATFVGACAPFALGAFEARQPRVLHRVLGLLILASLIACAMVSGARASIIYTGGMMALFLLGNLLFAPMRRKGIALISGLLLVLAVAGLAFILQGAVEATTERFQTASEGEDFVARVLSIFMGEPGVLKRVDWLGAGIGIGSNLAQFVQFSGRTVFVYAESEAGRTLIEGGLAGALFILIKAGLVVIGLAAGLRRAVQSRAAFPLLVWVAISIAVLTWPVIGQLSAHGLFSILLALGLLCLRYPTLRLFG